MIRRKRTQFQVFKIRWRATSLEMRVGLYATFGLLIFIFIFSFVPVSNEGSKSASKWSDFAFSPANEIGDAIAGLAGTLAFLWLIVTAQMQARELRLQRKELAMNRKEMADQRMATQDMARSLEAQARIFEDELKSRHQQQASALLHERIELNIAFMIEHSFPKWTLVSTKDSGGSLQFSIHLVPIFHKKPDDAFNALRDSCRYISVNLKKLKERVAEIVETPRIDQDGFKMSELLGSIIELKPRLSESDQLLVERLAVEEAKELIDSVLNEQSFWQSEISEK